MRYGTTGGWLLAAALAVTAPHAAMAQSSEPATRADAIEESQSEKVKTLTPQMPNRFEVLTGKANQILTRGGPHWYPFFESSYSGGGFPFGAGYSWFVSAYNTLDVRGSLTISGYKRIESEFLAPRLFARRGTLSVLGGWREATAVPFYGLNATSSENRLSYGFKQPFGSALLTLRPTRRLLVVHGGVEYSQWKLQPGEGNFPSIDDIFTPGTLPGLGAKVNYLHTQVGAGFDWRGSPAYARRGGSYGVTFHDYADKDDRFGFREITYEAIQHVPILREAWVLSFRGLVTTSYSDPGQRIPFFMTPYIGNGSTLRAYNTKRFRGDNTMLMQGEWRIMINRFMETAFFYDTGKAVERREDLNFDDLKSDYGVGYRLHSVFRTLLRFDVAHGSEGFRFVTSVEPVF